MIPVHRSSLSIWCVLIGIAAGCLADGTLDRDDTAAGLPATAPEVSKVSQAGEIAAAKPVPVKPQDTPGVTTDGTLPDKPKTSAPTATPEAAWTVNLVASLSSQWAGLYATLTATTNMDVGPTVYYIRIWDDESGSFIGTCGTGTACSISFTRTGPRFTTYKAVVADLNGTSVASAFVNIHWRLSGLLLTESETTVATGSPVVLTTLIQQDIAATPYYVQIYDDTTRTIVQSCGAGTRCSVSLTQATATTHRYRACFTGFSASYPAPNILECTPPTLVTWTGNPALRVSLQPSSSNAITATASIDVGPTPHFIQIFRDDGTRLAFCGSGRSCTVSISGNPVFCVEHSFATIGPLSSTAPATAPAISHVFPWRLWAGPMQAAAGPTEGVAIGPCPSPRPR